MTSIGVWRSLGALALAGAVLGSIGCSADGGSDVRDPGNEAAQGQLAAAPKGAEAAQEGPGARRPFAGRGPGGGPAFLLGAALRELSLTDAQRSTIEGAMQKAAPDPGKRGPMAPEAQAALIAGVRGGDVDVAAVLAKAGDEPPGMAEHHAALAEALSTLHATLTKEQRRALVDSVKKHAEERGPGGDHPGRMGPPPGEEGFKGHGPPDADGRPTPPHGGPLGFLLGGLNLTDAQKESIHKALTAQKPGAPDEEAMKKDFEARRAGMDARLDLFAADTFDAKVFLAPPKDGDAARGPKKHFERMLRDLAVVVPLLDSAQREALAAQIEKGPPPPPAGEHGMRGPRGMRGAGPHHAPPPPPAK